MPQKWRWFYVFAIINRVELPQEPGNLLATWLLSTSLIFCAIFCAVYWVSFGNNFTCTCQYRDIRRTNPDGSVWKKTFLFSLFTIQVLHMHLTLVCVQTETSACFMLSALLFLLLPMFSFTLLKKKFSTMDSIRLFITFMFLQEHIL